MPREIKFRGKRIDNGEWVYGVPITGTIQTEFGHMIWVETTRKPDFGEISRTLKDVVWSEKIDPESIGEFTGLKDSKRTVEYPEGQPIYEGDIIKADLPCCDGLRKIRLTQGRVYFDKGSFKVTDRPASLRLDDFANDVILEVLGNVWDNPELLEVTHG